MLDLYVPALYLLSGIAATMAIQQLALWNARSRDASHLIVALQGAVWCVTVLFDARAFSANSAEQLLDSTRWVLDGAIVVFGLMPWFVAAYTGVRHAGYLVCFTVIAAVALLGDEILPYTLQFERVDLMTYHVLPWGETITRLHGSIGPWFRPAAVVLIGGSIGYALVEFVRHYRATRDRGTAWILVGFAVFLATAIEAVSVRLNALDFIELGPYGFTFLIVVIGAMAARDTRGRLETSEQRFHALFESAPQAMLALDPQSGRVSESNAAAQALLGFTARELAERSYEELMRSEDLPDARRRFERLVAGELHTDRLDRWYRRKDGSYALVDCAVSALRDAEGRCLQIVVNAADIGERRRTEELLRESEKRLRAVIGQSPIGIVFVRDGVTVDVNDVFLHTFGYDSVDQVRGRPIQEHVAPQDRQGMDDRIRRRKAGEQVEEEYETTAQRRDGSQFPVLVSAKRLVFADGPVTIGFVIDMSRQKASEEEIRRLAFYDQLTGLANRQLLNDRVRRTLASSARRNQYNALLLIDLDNFKAVNDSQGHEIGDHLLREVGRRLTGLVWEGDTVARLGGDEFVVLLESLSERQAEAVSRTERVGEDILELLSRPFLLEGHELRATCSIGATLFRDPRMAPEDLIKQADIAMYDAKTRGRNVVRFFDPRMQELINSRATLEHDLHKAIELGQFVLHYQIQVDASGLPIGAEALIRWLHPTRHFISPAHFIPLAEETGQIIAIGQWVLEHACAQLARWRQDPLTRELVLAINVSTHQFRKAAFVDQVRMALRQHGVNPAQLKLELTESMLVEDVEEVIATMNALKSIGIRFSLDDFGTGYSSLQYLRRLPLDQLKIDQSFVRDIAVDANAYAIVRTVIAMAQSLGVDVIAEGVETEEQLRLLRDSGCPHFQGYLFGKPVPAGQLEAAIESSLIGHRPELPQAAVARLRR